MSAPEGGSGLENGAGGSSRSSGQFFRSANIAFTDTHTEQGAIFYQKSSKIFFEDFRFEGRRDQ
jgi:hypothetical protein